MMIVVWFLVIYVEIEASFLECQGRGVVVTQVEIALVIALSHFDPIVEDLYPSHWCPILINVYV